MRVEMNLIVFFCGSAALDGTDGYPLASVAVRGRQGELGLSLLGSLVRPGRLTASDGLPAGRSGSVRCVRLDSTVVRAHVSAAGAPQNKGAEPVLGRNRGLELQDPHPSGSKGMPPVSAPDGRQCHDRIQARALVEAWIGAPLPCLIADWAYDSDAFRAWLEPHGIEAVLPA